MKNHRRWTLLAVLATSVLFIQQARAATLTGKVIEVNDGDEITIDDRTRGTVTFAYSDVDKANLKIDLVKEFGGK